MCTKGIRSQALINTLDRPLMGIFINIQLTSWSILGRLYTDIWFTLDWHSVDIVGRWMSAN